jgi:hypothetical protein
MREEEQDTRGNERQRLKRGSTVVFSWAMPTREISLSRLSVSVFG